MPKRLTFGGLTTLALITRAYALPVETSSGKALIQIAVEVVEVNENQTRKLGMQFLDTLHIEEQSVPSIFKVGTLSRSPLFADLQVLMQKGGADLLANPKLVTREGTTASFHAGGEIPYATAGTLGTVNVEFKPYGVDLKINPHVDSDGRIAMTLDTEVSAPDTQNSVTLSGNVVPGMLSRRVSNQLTLDPGSTLTIAGLVQSSKEWAKVGIPLLMDIPGFGLLFSHKVQTNRRTSIVIFATPTLLTTTASTPPAPPGPAALPILPAEDPDDLPKSKDDLPSEIHG